MEDAAFKDALIDSGYSRMSCSAAVADFCSNFMDAFYNYSVAAEEVLNDSFFSVSLSPTAFCRLAATGMNGYQETYYANYSLALLVNSTAVFEHRSQANESLLDLNRSDEGVFKLRLRDASGNELHAVVLSHGHTDHTRGLMGFIERYGRPVALYTDWASHFRQPQGRGKRPALTQIQRALLELGIELICANSPQAKGRVERSHGTDQGRLVTELRLAGIRRMVAANRYLDEVYLPKVNGKFAVAPASAVDAHRPAAGYDLAAILCVQEQRTVQNDWTVSIDGRRWQIQADAAAGKLRPKARVTLERRRDGSLRLRWQGRHLAFGPAPSALAARLVEAARQERLEWEGAGQDTNRKRGLWI